MGCGKSKESIAETISKIENESTQIGIPVIDLQTIGQYNTTNNVFNLQNAIRWRGTERKFEFIDNHDISLTPTITHCTKDISIFGRLTKSEQSVNIIIPEHLKNMLEIDIQSLASHGNSNCLKCETRRDLSDAFASLARHGVPEIATIFHHVSSILDV